MMVRAEYEDVLCDVGPAMLGAQGDDVMRLSVRIAASDIESNAANLALVTMKELELTRQARIPQDSIGSLGNAPGVSLPGRQIGR